MFVPYCRPIQLANHKITRLYCGHETEKVHSDTLQYFFATAAWRNVGGLCIKFNATKPGCAGIFRAARVPSTGAGLRRMPGMHDAGGAAD